MRGLRIWLAIYSEAGVAWGGVTSDEGDEKLIGLRAWNYMP